MSGTGAEYHGWIDAARVFASSSPWAWFVSEPGSGPRPPKPGRETSVHSIQQTAQNRDGHDAIRVPSAFRE